MKKSISILMGLALVGFASNFAPSEFCPGNGGGKGMSLLTIEGGNGGVRIVLDGGGHGIPMDLSKDDNGGTKLAGIDGTGGGSCMRCTTASAR